MHMQAESRRRDIPTFKEWAMLWMETYKKPNVNPRTYKLLRGALQHHVYPYIGSMYLDEIKQIDIQRIINSLSEFSKSYIQKTYLLIKGIFESAYDNSYVDRLPTNRIILPKGYSNTHRALTKEERVFFLQACEQCGKAGLWGKVMYYCGLRPDEVSKIQGRDIDRVNHILHVRGTKTEKSDRYVPIPDKLVLPDLEDDEYLIVTRDGNPITKSVRKRYWDVIVRRMNILMGCKVNPKGKVLPPYRVAQDLVPYCLRHNYATICQESGIDIGVAAKLLGHTTTTITLRVYTHNNMQSIMNANINLSNYF